VNGEELQQFVPDMLEARYPGRSREMASDVEGLPPFGWVLELDDCLALIRPTQTTHPFIMVRGGIAHALPRSEALATDVAAGNKHLMVGRLYLAYGEEVAMVVFDEAIFGEYLSLQYEPSVQDVVNRFETSLQYTAEWTKTIREKFGGQSFTADDWHLMSF
jgi:hypothetical protein